MLNVNLMYLGPITGAVAYKWVGELIRGGGGLISGGAYTWGGAYKWGSLYVGGAYKWGSLYMGGGAYKWGSLYVGGGGGGLISSSFRSLV